MSRVFVDTSAILALFLRTDAAHQKAVAAFDRLSERSVPLLTTSYVLVETCALLTRRSGLAAVRAFHEDFFPLLRIIWVDDALHSRGLDALLRSGRKKLSLVDCVSIDLMTREKITDVFAYDRHFVEAGFSPVQ